MRNKANTRKCVVCREHCDKCDLLRFAVEDGTVCLDLNQKAEGRGAYVCKKAECIATAQKKGALARALKHPVDISVWTDAEDAVKGLYGQK